MLDILASVVPVSVLLMIGLIIGSRREKKHFADLKTREKAQQTFIVTNIESLPSQWIVESVGLAQGNVVISIDYFKRFVASFRALVGGRLNGYQPLLDRARREALLRMIENAKAAGFDAVVNTRLETSRLANSTGRGTEGIAGVEMLAYGTAIKLQKNDT